jgi:hypothetical protein
MQSTGVRDTMVNTGWLKVHSAANRVTRLCGCLAESRCFKSLGSHFSLYKTKPICRSVTGRCFGWIDRYMRLPESGGRRRILMGGSRSPLCHTSPRDGLSFWNQFHVLRKVNSKFSVTLKMLIHQRLSPVLWLHFSIQGKDRQPVEKIIWPNQIHCDLTMQSSG